MENGAVYSSTTEAHPGPARGARGRLTSYFTLKRLRGPSRFLKYTQLVMSLLAFICEEIVSQCTLCGGLYFFEFVSCSAFLLSLLILIVYCTPVYDKVEPAKVKSSDFYITAGTGFVFLVASLIFVFTHDNTVSELFAIGFGFLASLAFLFDFFIMVYEKCKQPRPRKPEATTRTEPLTEPLNA
uniref:CKLF like MARVEL transmembrane domain containing 6 n=1 Tax=Catagonus wagneri TaxID=51154 RepID=A0A8C3XB11_9CETA